MATVNDHIDLMLTDIMLQMNGQELYQKVIQVQSDIKVLFLSGYTDDIVVNNGLLCEGANFLQKPFSIKSHLENVRLSLIDNEGQENIEPHQFEPLSTSMHFL